MTHKDWSQGREPSGRGVPGRADVWLGDLAVAVEEIAPVDEEGFRRVARLLGLGRQLRADELGPQPPPSRNTVVRLDPAPPDEPVPTASSTDAAPSAPGATPGTPAPVATSGTSASVATSGTPAPGTTPGEPAPRATPAVPTWPDPPTGTRDGDGTPRSGGSAEVTDDRGTQGADIPDPVPRRDADSAHEAVTAHRGERPPPRTLTPVEHAHEWRQTWAREALSRPDPELMRLEPPHTPLLARSSTVALLEAALSGTVRDGDVEIEDAVELLARGLPLAALPRRVRRTLRHGVQILVDRGPAMELFARDQAELCARVRALVGKDKTEQLHFSRSPLRGAGAGPLWTWDAYRPPPRGSAVLLLSDCGTIGPPGDHARSTPAEWRRFAESVRHGGARPLALLPVPERRVPGWLATIMPVLCWDRGITVGRVAARVSAWRERCGPHGIPPTSQGGRP
ncbi:hypothetical protein [Streptomyces sp. NEAU-NA10]|uniref:hypothetical protein n=1 Tax=Streptomyces sp. NEAU-NA10 TaxID=3416050 RepID=UPI003CC555A6